MDSVSDYYSATQLRSDRWSALRASVGALDRAPTGKSSARDRKTTSELLDALALIEPYWAFPGMAVFDHLRRQFEHGSYTDLAFTVGRITRALTTGAYRRRSIPLERDIIDKEADNDEALLSPEARALTKPYFEVLIVDDVNEQQERWLRNNVTGMRRAEDPFTYEAVVVPSLEDALIAVLFNHNIQAIVVRPGLVLRSKIDNEILHKYLNRAGSSDEFDAMLPENYGPELCRLIARVRPELDAYLVTDRSVEDIAGHDLGICRRVFYN
ncbi:MAG: ornithine decarboxylase, partial [Yoonia sp.]